MNYVFLVLTILINGEQLTTYSYMPSMSVCERILANYEDKDAKCIAIHADEKKVIRSHPYANWPNENK